MNKPRTQLNQRLTGTVITKPVPLKLFSDREAWDVFRLAAFAEAFGWTLLIAGIAIKHFWTPGNDTPVRIAGEIHGTIFLFYLATVVIAAGSLGWSYRMTFIAGLASVPPYGTLVLEQILARHRHKSAATALRHVSVRAIIMNKDKLLMYQPRDGVLWLLPGGVLAPGESAKAGLERLVHAQTGITPKIGELSYVYETHRPDELVELYFSVLNAPGYTAVDFGRVTPGSLGHDIDEIGFKHPKKTADLAPSFLKDVVRPDKPDKKVRFIDL